VRDSTFETPRAVGNGGLNSSLWAGTITTANPLPPADDSATPNVFENQISLTFLMDVIQNGRFRFFINIEALPSGAFGEIENRTEQSSRVLEAQTHYSFILIDKR
jgi:hypothetical protein